MGTKAKVEDFSIIPPDGNLDSNIQSYQNDWNSINFTESKHAKNQDRLKLETHEEIGLFKDPNQNSFIDQL